MVVGAKKLPGRRGSALCYNIKCSAKPAHAGNNRSTEEPVPTWQEDPASEPPSSSQGDLLYSQIQVRTQRELVSNVSIELYDDSIYRIATGRQAALNGPFDILIIRDPIHKPAEIAVIPKVQTLELGEEIFISVTCLDYPYWLPAGIPIAQAFLLPKDLPEEVPENPTVLWAQIMGTSKPITKCTLFSKGEKIKRKGVMDTGAHVTLRARSEWLLDWELEPIPGFISGIGGIATSWHSKWNVVITGPEGKVATIRPFVVRATITLWGRDILS